MLEIGPGLGSLTLGLLEAARQVIAVEIDPLLAGELQATVTARMPARADALTVITADALRIEDLPFQPTAVVANLPYNVSVPVLLHLLATFPSWQRGLVMVQAEVADRLAATPGSKIYGVPSVKMAWYADVARVGSVPPTVFWPMPNVESGLVSIRRRPEPITTATRAEVFYHRRCGLRPATQDVAIGALRSGRLVGGSQRRDRGGRARSAGPR